MGVGHYLCRCKKQTLIHHSDRGIQYYCDDYQRQLEEHHIQVSMTESYDPYANAVAERINATIKHEFLLEELECDLRTQQQVVAQSVAIYNELRPHLSCGMLTPNQMHRQCKKEIVTYRTKNDNTASPCCHLENFDYFCIKSCNTFLGRHKKSELR